MYLGKSKRCLGKGKRYLGRGKRYLHIDLIPVKRHSKVVVSYRHNTIVDIQHVAPLAPIPLFTRT